GGRAAGAAGTCAVTISAITGIGIRPILPAERLVGGVQDASAVSAAAIAIASCIFAVAAVKADEIVFARGNGFGIDHCAAITAISRLVALIAGAAAAAVKVEPVERIDIEFCRDIAHVPAAAATIAVASTAPIRLAGPRVDRLG